MILGMDIEFNPDHADSILEHCQNSGMNKMESWLHLIAAAVSLCPKKEMSQAAIELIYDIGDLDMPKIELIYDIGDLDMPKKKEA